MPSRQLAASLAPSAAPPTERLSAQPPQLDEPAFLGLAGDVVAAVVPFAETSPAALLLQFLATFSSAVGPSPHVVLGGVRHRLNLFLVSLSRTSRSRLDAAWAHTIAVFA